MAQILGKAYLCFPTLKLTKPHVLAWHDFFKQYDPHMFATAMNTAIREPERKFFPTPGEVEAEYNQIIRTRQRERLEHEERTKRLNAPKEQKQEWTPEQLIENKRRFQEIFDSIGEGSKKLDALLKLKISEGGYAGG